MTRRRWCGGVLLVAMVATAAGCGVPGGEHLQRVDPATVPFHLLATAPPGTTTPPSQGPATNVFFVRDDHLATAQRHVVGEAVAADALRAMFLGPTPQEAARGMTSDVPAQTRLISLDLKGSVATVDLSSQFSSVGGSEQVLAVAQIVYTLTASKYIDSVRFSINGKVIEVPDGTGSLSDAPHHRNDYKSLAGT